MAVDAMISVYQREAAEMKQQLAIITRDLEAARGDCERLRTAAKNLRKIQTRRELDEDNYAAAGQTYTTADLNAAEQDLDDVIAAASRPHNGGNEG